MINFFRKKFLFIKEKVDKHKNIIFWILFSILMGLIIFSCFFKLSYSKIDNYDEARHGVNAYEMYMSKDFIVTTYGYDIDYWNLKPPLSEYLICIGYRLVGFNALGLRLYSAIAMTICAFAIGMFLKKNIGRIASICALLAFLATNQLYYFHCARAGDADSLYILFYALSLICLLKAKKSNNYIYLACLCFSFSFLTKSWHAGCIAILVIMYLFYSKKIFSFKLKDWFLCIISALGPILLWGLFRFNADGVKFFTEMIDYDLLKRTSNALEDHSQSRLYYFKLLFNHIEFFGMGLAFFISTWIMNIKKFDKDEKINLITIISAIIIPFAVFTYAETKLEWYVFCAYPAIILLFGYAMQYIYNEIKKSEIQYNKIFLIFTIFVFILLGIAINVKNIISIHKDDVSLDSKISKLLDRNQEYDGRNMYRNINEAPEQWSQSEFLTAEFYGNVIPKEGEVESWINDKNGYLIVKQDLLNEIEIEYKIINQHEEFYVIGHL